MNSEVQMVVFDMAGTTVDEGKIVYKSVQQALAESGVTISLTQVLEIGGWNKKEGIRHLLNTYSPSEVSPEKVDQVHQRFLEIASAAYATGEGIQEMPGATEVFRELKSRGIKVVLDTGYFRDMANVLIDHMGWKKHELIDYSVTSDEVERGRPYPYMIQKAMEQLEVHDPAKVIKVGDTLSDIEEGKNAGCGWIIAIASGAISAEKLMENKPTKVIHELKELLELIN
ncbi:MAG: phosphonatase-like hydrolase [Bacteroidota bacterium]